MKKHLWKSIGAVLAGLLVVMVVTTLVDIAFHALHIYPPLPNPDAGVPVVPLTDGLALLASSYRLVISVGAAYLTAKLSPGHPIRDAVILGLVGTALGAAGAVMTWNMGLGPHWYTVSLAMLAIPQCWLGGWLFVRRHPGAPASAPATP